MSAGFLLLRRHGGVWGVPHAAVRGLAARAGGYRVTLEDAALEADEILGLVPDLEVQPATVLKRFWPEESGGLAVHENLPVLIVDPRRPPQALRVESDSGDPADA